MTLHYVAGGGIENNGKYTAGTAGFNLADVQSLEQLNALPDGVKGLVWLDKAEGVTSEFIAKVSQYIGNDKLWGFYLADEPDPTGQWGTKVSAADLKAESDWIHANVPGAKTFIVMMNMGMTSDPTYMNTYNPANTGIDYYGLDPYPIRTGGNIDLSSINKNVEAAIKAGIPLEAIVPVYQAFGGGGWSTDTGGKYVMPTSAQMKAMIDHWATVVPDPIFDYAYHWESQNGDQALSTNSALLDVFRQHNTTSDPAPVIETLPPVTEPVHPPTDGSGSTAGSGTGTTPPVTEPTDPGTGSGSTAGSGTGTTPPVTEPTMPSTGTGSGSTAGSGTGTTPPVSEPTPPVVDTGSTGGGRGHGKGGHGDNHRGDWADAGHKFGQKFASSDSFRFSEATSKFADGAASAGTADFITKFGANARSQFVDKLAALGLTADGVGSNADASAQSTASVDASPPANKMAHHQHFAWDHLWG
ncbi:MAG: calcium-binding protein [Phreatobacter sp.]|uniref:calcium-binding protein n=1 Tax=Phreatobacter sp. TaxID=1966341 RepID=UPI001A5161E9|nr:calcium-binding protein [Phreatobacter sp.]MBL8568655.1 calcium-binding protein [Phreatobacter sp.]